MVFGANTGFGVNTAFGMNTVCELFPHIHTEGFHCVHSAIFTANLHAVCQPYAMQIHGDIIVNLHCIVCVKALLKKKTLMVSWKKPCDATGVLIILLNIYSF